MKAIEMVGRRFGRLLVKSRAETITMPSGYTIKCFTVRCDCGTVKTVRGYRLRSENLRSCGCLRSEIVTAKNTKHGGATRLGKSPEYQAWEDMKKRCGNPNHKDYGNWGGRGIMVCREWLDDFRAFFAHVGQRPSRRHSIDRWPDNDGHYEPGNVRWATKRQQTLNQRPRRRRRA